MAVAARAQSFTVPGTSDPWLANGVIDNIGTPEPPDVAPTESPVSAGSVTVGDTLMWSASGLVGHPGDIAGPDGAAGVIVNHMIGANNGIPDITAPIDSLIGVFTGPAFGQIFIMGSAGTITVPAGATAFYMGTMDGYGWANNIGQFDVKLEVPETSSTLILLMPLVGLMGFVAMKRKQAELRS